MLAGCSSVESNCEAEELGEHSWIPLIHNSNANSAKNVRYRSRAEQVRSKSGTPFCSIHILLCIRSFD